MTKLNTRCYYQLTILPCASSYLDMAIFRLVGDVYSLSAVQYLFVSGAHGSERTPANDVARRHCSSFFDEFH